jgi:hypothetical protein
MGLGFKTFVAGTLSASDVQGYLMQQSVVTCTAATRPGSPLAGMTIYQTDTDTHWVFNGMIWHEIVPAKQRLAFVPGGNLDTPLAGTATWMTFGSVNVPTWATQCIVSLTLHGIYPAGAIGTSTSAAVKIGTATGSLIRVLDPGVLGQRFQYSYLDQVTGLGALSGAQTVTLAATFSSGTGVYRADTTVRPSATFDFLQ